MRGLTAPLVKLVVFIVVTALATLFLAATIANSGSGDSVEYRAQFTDVTGLVEGDDVRVSGVRVGSVTDIRVVKRTFAEVTFEVSTDRPLPASTRAQIRYRNLVGTRYLALTEGKTDAAAGPAMLAAGDLIPLTQTTPSLDLTVLFGGFKPLFQALSPTDVNRLSYELIQVLQGEGGTVTDLLGHIESLTTTLADRDAVIGRVIDNLTTVMTTLSDNSDQLSSLILQLQQFVTGLNSDKDQIFTSIQSINDLATVTTDLLVNTRPALAADIAGLQDLAANLNANGDVLEQTLQLYPNKLATITRTASYGSWFNFYLCRLQGIDITADRCKG